jgi:hypothetical protein
MHTGNFIITRCKSLLENKQQAVMYAVLFSVLPFASWISVALVSLVSLRKGARSGFEVLVPALVMHSIPLMMLVTVPSALINTLIAYIPCYFAALSLRSSEKWQVASGVFLVQAILGCFFIQFFAPELIVEQFNQFKALFLHYQELIDTQFNGINSLVLAHLFFGIQILSIIFSSLISLIFARSLQAKLFLPGGFRNELMAFRGGKLSFLVFLGVFLGSYYEIPLAINVLPTVLCYFLSSGFILVYFICSRKRQVGVFILLIVLILLKPTVMLSAYILIGLLDSLFNLRSYLPSGVRGSV